MALLKVPFADFVAAIAEQESGNRGPNPMQIQPATFERFKRPGERYDNPEHTRAAAIRYLEYLYDKTGGDAMAMAAGYFGGEGGISPKNWQRMDRNRKTIASYVNDILNRIMPKAQAATLDEFERRLQEIEQGGERQPQPMVVPPSQQAAPAAVGMPPPPPPPAGAEAAQPQGQSTRILGKTPADIWRILEPAAEGIGGMLGGTYGASKLGATAGGAAGGPVGALVGAVAGGALGAAAGSRLHRFAGQLLGYAPAQSLPEAAKETAEAVGRGAVAEVGGAAAHKVLATGAIKVGDAVRKMLTGGPDPRALADAAATQIPLSASEAGKRGLDLQHVLRSAPLSRPVYDEHYERQVIAAADAIDSVIEKFHGTRGISPADVGERIQSGFKKLVAQTLNARALQGRHDFGLTDAMMNEQPYIDVSGYAKQLRTEIARLVASGLPAKSARARQLTRMLNRLAETDYKMSGFSVNAQLSDLLSSAYRDEGLFVNLGHNAADRAMALRLFKALDNDLVYAAGNLNTMEGAVGQSLLSARNNWREATKAIKEIRHTVLGKMLQSDRPLDTAAVYNRVINMGPVELRKTISMLDKADPTIAADIRTAYLEDVLKRVTSEVPDTTTRDIVATVSPRKFITLVRKNDQKFMALFGTKATEELDAIYRQLVRIHSTGTPSTWIGHVLIGGASGIVLLPFLAGSGDVNKMLTNLGFSAGVFLSFRQLAKLLVQDEGKRALTALLKKGTPPSQAIRAWGHIASQLALRDFTEEEAELE